MRHQRLLLTFNFSRRSAMIYQPVSPAWRQSLYRRHLLLFRHLTFALSVDRRPAAVCHGQSLRLPSPPPWYRRSVHPDGSVERNQRVGCFNRLFHQRRVACVNPERLSPSLWRSWFSVPVRKISRPRYRIHRAAAPLAVLPAPRPGTNLPSDRNQFQPQ